MKKIICIGECAVDIIFNGNKPVGSIPGSRVVNAAALLARHGKHVIMAGEAAADAVGDIVVDFLSNAGVDVNSVDRFTEGRTPVLIYINDEATHKTSVTRYEDYPDDCFDIIWPRIDEGDIVLFGGYYAIDRRMRNRMSQLLHHAAERKAILVYMPGYMPQQETRITHVMPSILENLEIANMVITRNRDLEVIFSKSDSEKCYHNHIDFYCRSLVNFNCEQHAIEYYNGNDVTRLDVSSELQPTMMWNAGATAGVISALFDSDLTADDLDTVSADVRQRIVDTASAWADDATKAIAHDWQKMH